MITQKYKIIPNTNERYGVDRFGNVRDLLKDKAINDYNYSGSVNIKFSDKWRSVSQKRLIADLWSEEIRTETLNPKEAIQDEIKKLKELVNNSLQKIELMLGKSE